MSGSIRDAAIDDLGRACIRLEDGLRWTPQFAGREVHYQVTRSDDGHTFQVGLPEYTFISLLDGDTRVAEAVSIAARQLKSDAFTAGDAQRIIRWLIDHRLAKTEETGERAGGSNPQGLDDSTAARRPRDLFWWPIPLIDPHRWLSRLEHPLGWIYSSAAIPVWGVLWVVALFCLVTQFPEFQAASAGILAPSNWLAMLLAWAGLKVVHELAHGLACTRFGGEVHEAGIVMILLAPVAYLDASSSSCFRSRWQRFVVAAAGIHIELTIAAVCVLLWTRTSDPQMQQWLFNIAFMAGVSTILFNANPLMKFDGYYMLSDLLGMPNLASRSTQCFKSSLHRLMFGEAISLPKSDRPHRWPLTMFGALLVFWRLLVCTTLSITAAQMFHGFGVLLACAAVIVWLFHPARQFARHVLRLSSIQPQKVVRFAGIVTVVLPVLYFGMFRLEIPVRHRAAGIVQFRDDSVLRASASGFVREVFVADGQTVKAGDILLRLENEELTAEILELQQEAEAAALRYRAAMSGLKSAQAQIEEQNRESIERQLAEKREQLQGLSVVAPCDGRIIARNLDTLPGTYAEIGQELLTVADEHRKELLLLIPEDASQSIMWDGIRELSYRTRSSGRRIGRLERATPRATRRLEQPALSAPLGGPLAVQPRPDITDDREPMELLLPHLTAVVQLEDADAAGIRAGELGYALLEGDDQPAGILAWNALRRWIESKLEWAARDQST